MSLTRPVSRSILLCVCLLAACVTAPEEEAARAEAQSQIEAEISARQGEAVNRICPRGNDGWKALRDDILLLEASGDWYMAKLSGACDPDSAFAVIATRTDLGSSCLQRGDDIYTGRPRSGGRCVITGLYEWDEDAEIDPATSAGPVEE